MQGTYFWRKIRCPSLGRVALSCWKIQASDDAQLKPMSCLSVSVNPGLLHPTGIMTHHVGYTLLFEQALQVVNPAVSIPYWEYTIEGISDLGLLEALFLQGSGRRCGSVSGGLPGAGIEWAGEWGYTIDANSGLR